MISTVKSEHVGVLRLEVRSTRSPAWAGLDERTACRWVGMLSDCLFSVDLSACRMVEEMSRQRPRWLTFESHQEPPATPWSGAVVGMSAAHGFERRYLQLIAGNGAEDSYVVVEITGIGEQESFALVRDSAVVVFRDMLGELGRGELSAAWFDPLARRDGRVALNRYLPPPGSGPDARSPDKPKPCWATLISPTHRAMLDPLRCAQAVIFTDVNTEASVVAAPFPPSCVDVECWIEWFQFLAPATGPLDLRQAVTDGAFTHGAKQ